MKQTFASHAFRSHAFRSGNWTGIGVPVEPEPAVCGHDMMAWGMASLTTQLKTHASQPVVYQRGNRKIALCATFARTKLMLSDEFGTTKIEWTDRDFLIPTADLVIAGSPTLPKRGDVIRHNDGVAIHSYEVLPYGDEPHWKWCDAYRQMVRIHTKRITTEAV